MEYEPSARWLHAAIATGHTMLVLAGNDGSGGFSINSSLVERFNATSTTWNQPHHLLNQALPDDYSNMGVTSDGEKLYMFGGLVGVQPCNTVYEIDSFSLECRKLVPATSATSPTARSHCGLVYWNRRLVVYGGTIAVGTPTDELFVFDLNTSEAVTITM